MIHYYITEQNQKMFWQKYLKKKNASHSTVKSHEYYQKNVRWLSDDTHSQIFRSCFFLFLITNSCIECHHASRTAADETKKQLIYMWKTFKHCQLIPLTWKTAFKLLEEVKKCPSTYLKIKKEYTCTAGSFKPQAMTKSKCRLWEGSLRD